MVKFTILLKRHPSLTPAEFVDYHRHRHAPLFASLPAVRVHVRRYVQQHLVSLELPGLPPVKYDGITELWFDDEAGLAALFQDPEYLARIRPDEEKFLDLHGCDFLLSREHAVI